MSERLAWLFKEPGRPGRLREVSERFNDFLIRAVAEIRERFGGRITYASIPFEAPDWTLFDIVAVELIRNADVAGQYRDGVRSLVAGAKPVAITGFGASAYRGATDRGARAMEIAEYDEATQTPLRLDGEYTRDEAGQAEDIRPPPRSGHGEPGRRQDTRRPSRRHLHRHDLGAQGRLHRHRRLLPQLTTPERKTSASAVKQPWIHPCG